VAGPVMKTYGGRYLESTELRELGVRSVGEDVRVHSTCVLVGLENLSLGSHIRIDAFCSILPGDGRITVGNHVHIASCVFLSGGEGIDIADFVGLSHGVRVYTRNDDYTGLALTGPTIPERYLKLDKGAVTIGRHVVVGATSIVLPGVTIGEGTTVGALSLVKSSLDPWGIYAGVPVRRLRERSRDLLELERQLRASE
jgi:acetyltransferase-like isoleucine patch superfamily enzyme